MIINNTQPGLHWRDQLKELSDGQKHAQAYADIMTPYERIMAGDALQKKLNAVRPNVIRGMVQEWHAAADALDAAMKDEIRERQAEIKRWDAGKLAGEMALVQAQLEGLDRADEPGKVIGAILHEAKLSGDLHKQRAAAEVIRSALGKVAGGDLEKRREVNLAAKEAERMLEDVRTTEGMQKAGKAASDAFDAVQAKAREMEFTEGIIGKSVEFQRAWRRVNIDPDTGKIEVIPQGE